ncbi:hypothetical protein [Pediococcus claussenii]|nr:hypothetical protein [Pediococcus claussenii]
MEEKETITIPLSIDTTELDTAIKKVERLNDALKEANSLMNELAKNN